MKRSAGILLLAIALFLSLTLACTGSSANSEEEERSSGFWSLIAPEGFSHALFSEDCLTDEQCWDCALADLEGGTKLRPLSGGCQRTTWDRSYIYCEVQVVGGDLHGATGWVNEKFMDKG